MKSNIVRSHKTKTSVLKTTSKYLPLAIATATLAMPMMTRAEEATAAAIAPPPSKVHALLNFEFSDHYLTPRGMNVQNHGLVFQQLALGFFDIYHADDFSLTLVGGVWNCFGSRGIPSSDSGGKNNTSWYEIDPIAGVSIGFLKNFTLDLTYTAFDMQILNIPFSQHLEVKFSFDDSKYLKHFALHPYFSYWQELDGKAVANTDKNPKSSYYFDLGIAPSYTFEKIGLKIEAPMRVLLPDKDFYGTGAGSASTVGLYELGLKASIPLKFMPQGYGHWSFHAGFKWMSFEDKNLQAVATGGGFGPTTRDQTAFFCGISTFF
jgi:hypothetical protein